MEQVPTIVILDPMSINLAELEKTLWGAADELRANSKLKSSEYSVPVLGLIFLRYADYKFSQAQAKLASQSAGRRTVGKTDYQALETLKREKLVLDWRKQQTTRAMVFVTIKDVLNELPRTFSQELYDQKCDRVYQHFYEEYSGRR